MLVCVVFFSGLTLHCSFWNVETGPPRSEMMGRSPRMDEQGMDMAPRMRPPMDQRPDFGRGGPMGPRPNFGPGLGRGVRPEGEMGFGPRMEMGPGGPRMELGPRGPVAEMRDPRQAADPRRMAAANAPVRPAVCLHSCLCH